VAPDEPGRGRALSVTSVEEVLRKLTPQVLATLVRRYRDFSRSEDAVQEALIEAVAAWSRAGIPDEPLGWLITVASRRFVDQVRADSSRERREQAVVDATPRDALVAAPADAEPLRDDTLELLFLCCHPALAPPSQMALTLRAVCGLTTGEIASAFFVPASTMGQRISRAKHRLRQAGAGFQLPPGSEQGARLAVVEHVLYLMFNEGYIASSGPDLQRPELTGQALRLVRRLHERLPESGETAGLLALMLLTDSRRSARTGLDGELIPLTEQDRSLWDPAAIAEGTALISTALATSSLGPYQLQAAIAAVHAESPSVQDTDWSQVLALYTLLERLAPSPVTTLNRAVALGMVNGPGAGLAVVSELETGVLAGSHRLLAVRAHLLERAGQTCAAAAAYQEAARRAGSLPEQRFLLGRAATCAG
jgi:RNA polymerase sigma factor (sigma-70 family)